MKCVSCLQVTFEGVAGNSYTGDIAIDSVEITEGDCPGENKMLKILPVLLKFSCHRRCLLSVSFCPPKNS